MTEERGRLVVVGQGYVGLPLAMAAVDSGWEVVGVDTDKRRVDGLAAGCSYVEDIPDERVRAALDAGVYTATTDPSSCAGFDVAVITVPTPLREGSPDLSYVEDAARTLAAHLTRGATVILESTTYPGTTEELVGPILSSISGLTPGVDFHLGYSPERIDPGNPRWRLENTPKVVSGIDPASLDAVDAFYSSVIERTVRVSTVKAAELTKLLENTFRHVNIALINELAMFAHELDIDIWETIDAASTKPFGYLRFTPGPGVGGHCLPIDPSYLSWRVRRSLGRTFRFVELANDLNDHMPEYVLGRLASALNDRRRALNGSRILLLGLAYKPNTGDARESPAMAFAHLLHGTGADVVAVDGHLADPSSSPVTLVELTAAEIRRADAVVLLTDHDDVDYALLDEATYVLDTRHRLRGTHVDHL